MSARGILNYPVRQASARGIPAEPLSFARTCAKCHASFNGLAPGKTGERGLWQEWKWYCSVECYPSPRLQGADNVKRPAE